MLRQNKMRCSIYLVCVLSFSLVCAYPQAFETNHFKIGVEYEHSLPMKGGSDRYRHRNNYEPFFVTVTATARKGYVISYLEVKAIVDDGGDVEFHLIRGQSGSTSMVFQLVSNHSDFLSYSFLAYGIKEDEYKKLTNVITLPMTNYAKDFHLDILTFLLFLVLYPFVSLS